MDTVFSRSGVKFPSTVLQSFVSYAWNAGNRGLIDATLAILGIDENTLQDPDHYITSEQLLALLRALKAIQDQFPPVQTVLKHFSPASFDLLALAGMSADNILGASEPYIRYGPKFFPSARFVLEKRNDGNRRAVVTSILDMAEMSPALLEITLCGLKIGADEYSGKKHSDCKLHFRHRTWLSRPAEEAEALYSHFSGCPVNFNSDFSGIEAPEAFWQAPLRMSNKWTQEKSLRLLEQLPDSTQPAQSVEEKVRLTLIQAADKQQYPTLDQVAEKLNVSARTLMRNLDKSGIRFKTLANDLRFERAKQLLTSTSQSTKAIAIAVGYGESSSFVRAFKSHTGLTPSQWRTRGDGN